MKNTLIRSMLVLFLLAAASMNVQGFIPDDADGDGVPDSVDACKGEDASGFDRDGDGCIDAFIGARHVEYWGTADTLITYLINDTGAPGISDGSDFAAIQSAFDTWAAISGTELNVAYGGTTTQTNSNGLDGVNMVTFVDGAYPFSSLVLAVGLSTSFESDTLIAGRVYRKGEIFDADMVFNPSKTYKVGGSGPGSDIQGIAVHEVGHMLGISHTVKRSATMHYVLPGGLAARSLDTDDELVYFKAYGDSLTLAESNRISGIVTNGSTSLPVGGAIVFLIDAATSDTTGCEFTLGDGSFTFPGIADGDYYVSIHPLNGTAPINYIEAGNINTLVEDIVDDNFNPEWYDAAESNSDDPNDRVAITVGISSPATDIAIVTNIDATGPAVLSTAPGAGASGVAIDGAYVVEFSEPVAIGTIVPSFSFRDDATMTARAGNIAVIRDDSVLVFTPSPALEYSTAYTLTIDTDLTDKFGNHLESDFTLSITTEPEPPLALTSLAPTKGVIGTTLVINGRGFKRVPADPTVTVGGAAATIKSVKPNQVVVTVPAGAATGPVLVVNADLTTSNPLTFTVLTANEVARGYESGQVLFSHAPTSVALTPGGEYAYVGTSLGAEAVIVSPSVSGYLTSTFIPYPSGLDDIAVNAEGTRAYAISKASGELVEIMADPSTGPVFNTVLASHALGAGPRGLVAEPSGDRAYVATDESEIQVWDTRLGSPTYQQQVGVLPAPGGASVGGAMAVTPAGDRLLAATDAGDLLFFDLDGDSLLTQIPVGADPRGISVDPQGERAYVSHLGGDISIVNIQGTPFQVQDVATGGSLRGLAITPAAQYLYVTDRELDNVKIVDLVESSSTFRTVVEDIETPINPVDIAISPEGLYAFSALQGGGALSPRLLVTTIGVGPVLQSVYPTAAPAGGQVVFSGLEFGDPQDFDEASVSFNGTIVAAEHHEFDKIIARVPVGASSGPVQVIVRLSGTTVDQTSNSRSFQVLLANAGSGTPRFAGAMAGPPPGTNDALAMSPNGEYLLVGSDDGSISQYDVRPGSPSYNQEINRYRPLGDAVDDMAITADGKTTFALTQNDGPLGRFVPIIDTDPSSPGWGKLRGYVGSPGIFAFSYISHVETSPDNRWVLVADGGRDQVYILDAAGVSDGAGVTVVDSISTAPGLIFDLEFHPSGLVAYIALRNPNNIFVVDMDKQSQTFGVVASLISVPGTPPQETPFCIDLTPDGNRLQILTYQLDGAPVTRSIFDYTVTNNGLTNTLQSQFVLETGAGGPGGAYQERMRISPQGNRAIRVSKGLAALQYYDPATADVYTSHGGVFETLTPNEFEYTPDGTRLYYASTFHDSVRVYDFYGGFTSVYYLAVASGNSQTGVINRVLPAPIRATTYGEGPSLPGLTITFRAGPGNGLFVTPDGLVDEINVATDAAGLAEVQWQLGPNVGTQTIQVIAEGIDQSPRTVSATATVDPATLPLALAEVLPLNLSSNVSTTTAVLATFSRAVDPATIGASSLFVRLAADATLIPVTYGFTDGNRKVSLTPGAPLGYSTQYEVVYTSDIEDSATDPLTNPGQSAFTTRARPPVALASVSPPSALRGVTLVLSGTSFDPVPANNTVLFNGVAATPTSATTSRLTVVVPLAATTGTIQVQVGAETSNSKPFTVLQPNTSPIDEVIANIGTGAGAKSCAVTPDGLLVYTVSPEGDVVIPVDVNGLSTYPSIPVGDQPIAIIIHPEGTFAYVANFNSGTVSVIGVDPSNVSTFNTVVATIAVGTNPIDLAIFPDGDRLLVANAGSSSVSVIDTDDSSSLHHQVLSTVPAGAGAKSLAVSPDGARIYVGNDTGFVVLDASGYTVLTSVPAGAGAKSMAVSPDGALLFILTDSGSILVVDVFPGSTSENEVLATVPAGTGGKSLAISADGTLLYVIQENSDEVLVFTIESVGGVSAIEPGSAAPGFSVTLSLVDTIDTGSGPADIAVDPTGSGLLFITNPGAKTLSIVNGSDVPLGQVAAEVHVDNLAEDVAADGFYVTGRVELPAPFLAQNIDLASVRLATTVPYVPGSESIVDEDNDGIDELRVKFLRHQYQAAVPQSYHTAVEISGEVPPRTFAGDDTIRTIRPVILRPEAGDFLPSNDWRLIVWASPLETILHRADVHVSVDDGQTWKEVAHQIPNIGLALWKTPADYHEKCWILVSLYKHHHWPHAPGDRFVNGDDGDGHDHFCGDEELYVQGINDAPFTVGSTVPTRLKTFDITMEDGAAVLRWETGVEIGMDGFAVVRSESELGVYREMTTETIRASGQATGGRYEFRDESVTANRTYWYKLQEITPDGMGAEFGPYSVVYKLSYGLEQNMPNPFNPTTTIKYALAQDGPVSLTIYDVRGARVRELVNERQRADVYKVVWDGTNDRGQHVSSGMYFYRLSAGKFTQTRKMLLLK
ncbi:MAG: beta-propeller fold lactonase family protein [Candidatus Krumholzibacteria bacterium]|nr:beta-propeller fold lactonase family protein [Candidatus Krumholzibacteria bacterium]MDH4336827.1 beta-propeller fold lactonase family protein [Candidatus Krumholzibacteria bacterium]MDH5269158.1 beta-propeller fold lactonase family protein [Candidatus Krumholzibacteria bacterium]